MGFWRRSHGQGHGQTKMQNKFPFFGFLFVLFVLFVSIICKCPEIQCLLYAGFLVFVLFIRPGVAGDDLQTAMSLGQSVGQSVTHSLSDPFPQYLLGTGTHVHLPNLLCVMYRTSHAGVNKNIYCLQDFFSSNKLSKKNA